MTDLYGLVGETLGHSISPRIHEMIFRQTGISGTYCLFEVERRHLQDAVRGLKALGVKGANVTIPYKTDIMAFLDMTSSEAKKIGAVNTIVIKEDIAKGYNTDYYGFGMALDKHSVDIKGKVAVVLGTGGSAKAVSHYLIDAGIGEIIFVSRNVEMAKHDGYKDFNIVSYSGLHQRVGGDILINCTPVGMYPHIKDTPIQKTCLQRFTTVFDLIYNPGETVLLKNAMEVGIKGINGLYMLVAQAIKSQELWHEITIGGSTADEVYIASSGLRLE